MTSVAADFIVSFTHLNKTMDDLRQTDSGLQFKASKDWSDGYGFFLDDFVDAEELQFRLGCTGFGSNHDGDHDSNEYNNRNNIEVNESVKDDDTDRDDESLCEIEDTHAANSEIIFLHGALDNKNTSTISVRTETTNTISPKELARMTIKWNPLSEDY
eukprot:m.44646 g.44646  ORF g.44646 m.44646 type:complete len:158 (-) comp19724_c1_seq1:73-546(-)